MPAWTDQERSRLLLAIIELLVPPKSQNKLPPWPDVSERMGAGFTPEAVRQQYQKLRKEGLPDRARSTPNTPQRNRLQQPAGIKKTPKRGRGKRLFAERQDSEEDDRESDENKKMKKEDEESRTVVKTERIDDEEFIRLNNDELSSPPSMSICMDDYLLGIQSLYD